MAPLLTGFCGARMETGRANPMFEIMRSALSLLVALAVAGCTPMAYQKAGVTTAQTRADEQECRSMAAREVLPMGIWIPGRPFGWRPRHYFGDPLLDRMHAEGSLADFCMRARGYELRAPT